MTSVARRPRWRPRSSARLRILGWYVVLLALASAASPLLWREVLGNQLDERVDDALVQEAGELARLVERGIDPATREPFGDDVAAIFSTFLDRTVPAEDEAFLAIVDGQPFRTTAGAPAPLDADPEQVARWAAVSGSGQRSRIETPAGPAQALAVPLERDGATRGVFVIAVFTGQEREELGAAVQAGAGVTLAVLAIASVLAWFIAGRVLAPVRMVSDAARRITETDLSRRLPVEGDDEIAELTATFNGMLDRLERAFVAQRQFVDDAGHELRTPITIVRGQLELMGDDPDERRETVALVTGELDRMARIVNDLVLLAKAEQEDFLALEPVLLGELVADVLVKARTLGDRDWHLVAPAGGTIVADPQRVTQVLVNLLSNAVQHTGPGDTIVLGAAVAGGWADLWVADSGTGVAPADRDRIFERFGRAAASRRRSEGAGLGLAIVSAVVAAHGGEVQLGTGMGTGARFTVRLPVDGPADAAARPSPAPGPGPDPSDPLAPPPQPTERTLT